MICFNTQKVPRDEIHAVSEVLKAVNGNRQLTCWILQISSRRLKHIIDQYLPRWKKAVCGRSKGWRPQQFKWMDWLKPIPVEGCYSDRDTQMLRLPSGDWYQRIEPAGSATEA